MPNYVVAVAPSWRGGGPSSAAEAMIWTHEFQRCCAAIARELPNTIAGRVGGEAAFFLTNLGKQRRSGARSRLIALGERIGRLMRRKLEVDVVCGFSEPAVEGGELPTRYDQALCAVFWGLHKHQPMTFQAEAGSRESAMNGLYASARVLCQSFSKGERPETFVAAERVVRDVLWILDGQPRGHALPFSPNPLGAVGADRTTSRRRRAHIFRSSLELQRPFGKVESHSRADRRVHAGDS